MEIIPSVLAKNSEELVEIKKKLEFYSGPLHIDVADDIFVPTQTVGLVEIEREFPDVPLWVHFMVARPEEVIPTWLGLPNLASVTFHIEATDKSLGIIDTIHQAGKKVGVAINPETDIIALGPILDKVDFVHFMTVHPGKYGGEFQSDVVAKISDFHAKYPTKDISADGGITSQNIGELARAGVSACIVGSDILNSQDPTEEFEKLKQT